MSLNTSQNSTTLPPLGTLKIHDLPPEDRPREKLSTRGAEALSDSELIAILLRTGIPGANAVDVARQLLRQFGSLGGLARCSVAELAAIKGVGPAKAVQLVAAFGLGARLARESLVRTRLDDPQLVYALLSPEMQHLRQENVRIVLLDAKYNLIKIEEISTGSLTESHAHPREVLRPALIHSAFAFTLVHNHPSGDPSPSQGDLRITRRLREAADLMMITLYDHIIIGTPSPDYPTGYISLRQLGML